MKEGGGEGLGLEVLRERTSEASYWKRVGGERSWRVEDSC